MSNNAFKDWTHAYLDDKGVPKEFPYGPHTREGCRIGDRMDWVFARIAELEAQVKRLEKKPTEVPLQILSDHGINPFAATLLAESYARRERRPKLSFVVKAVRISLEDA